MLKIRGCPHCGENPEIKVVIRDYGFNGVVIECPNCKAQIRNAKCSEFIQTNDAISTPITEESLLTYNGLTHTIAEWGAITGILPATIQHRISRDGWSVEDALTVPPKRGNRIMTKKQEVE